MRERFRQFTEQVSQATGSPWAFCSALAVVVLWAITGPFFHFSEVWQLVINTGTTIVTFLLGFIIQSTQNRDNRAIHVKLDELIQAVRRADNRLIGIEQQPEAVIESAAAAHHEGAPA